MDGHIRSRVSIFAFVLCVFTAAASAKSGREDAAESHFEQALRYTVQIRSSIQLPFIGDERGAFTGAGFVVDLKRRWIMTNAHVVSRSPSRVEAAFRRGEFHPVRKVYMDPYLDLAIIELPEGSMPPQAQEVKLGCGGDNPPMGHPVGAFGHPWGLLFTGTRGIVSGVTAAFGSEWLQTDAPVNGGNSGGPLISLVSGKVVGINSASIEKGKSEGLNFAIPINYACHVLQLLQQGRDPSPPDLPVTFLDDDQSNKLIVASVVPDKPNLGFMRGDIVQRVAGRDAPVRRELHLMDALRGRLDDVRVEVLRNGETVTLQGRLPANRTAATREGVYTSGLLIGPSPLRDGALANLTDALVIHYVDSGSVASLQEVKAWSFVEAVDGTRYDEVDALYRHLQQAADSQGSVKLLVKKLSDDDHHIYDFREITLPVEGLRKVRG